MGIIDWFKNRTGQFDSDGLSEETVCWAADKAITLTNPKLRIISNWQKRVSPSVGNAIRFMQGLVPIFPAARPLSQKSWAGDPALRAFFVTPKDIENLLARSDPLRTIFEKHPEIDEACLVLGMAISEQKTFGMAVRGDTIQRDVAQNVVCFSDHKTRLCAPDEAALRRVIGIEIFEYLISRALTEIGAERVERQELQANRALIRTRLLESPPGHIRVAARRAIERRSSEHVTNIGIVPERHATLGRFLIQRRRRVLLLSLRLRPYRSRHQHGSQCNASQHPGPPAAPHSFKLH